MKRNIHRIISLLLVAAMLIPLLPSLPAHVHAAEAAPESAPVSTGFEGKKVSILSHSMSTYTGVSNNTNANSTIGSNDVYYTAGKLGVYQKDTWWQQAIDALGMELLVNNSWSGSCVFQPRKGAASVGYGDRAVNLHNDHTGEEPDIIWIYLGCNDFAYYKDTFGEAADVDYATLIHDNGNGTYAYSEPKTTCEAYAIMLHKATTRYPEAEIYCITSTARRDPDYADNYADTGQPTAYSAELHKVAQHFGFPVVDLEGSIPKEADLFDQHIGDKRAHCNPLGMDKITEAVLSVMLGTDAEIRHVTSPQGIVAEQAVLLGGSYRAEAELADGYSLAVTMDGKDVSAEVCKNGTITIEEVTGDIHVETVIRRDPRNFRWAFQDDILTSVGTSENVLTKLSGTVTNKILNDGIFQLNTSVLLKHDLPWVVEWECAEDWRGAMLVSHKESATKGMTYLTRTKGGQLCFGTYTGSQYDNYGIDISYLDSETHSYRLENRIAEDGSNMVWLYVDGEEIGPMNNYFIGSKDQNKTSDWVSGKDFVFSFIGMTGHTLRNCQLEYLSVTECDHTYKNGICTGCGAVDSDAYAGKTIACVGDSITCGVGVTAGETDYVTLLAKSLGMEYIRLGASGTTLCTGGHRTCNLKQLTEAKLAGADVVTILMGINDFDQAKEDYYTLGTIDSTDTSTIYGAVHMWCQRIEELRKTESLADTEFYFLTPVITAWNHSVSEKNNWDQSKTTIHGYTLRDLCNAIIEVCALYDVPVIDLNLISGIYYNSAEDNNVGKFGNDGIHPGETGHQMMAFALENALLKNNLKVDHDHLYGSWITTTYPGCCQGEQKRVCSVCSATESRQLDATGEHTYENGICTACGAEDIDGLPLEGINVLCLGDSITMGQGLTTDTRWTNVLASKYGWTLTNKSQGGISLSSYYYTANGKSDVSIAKKAEILKTMTTKPDVIIVWGGHNDTGYRYSPLGTWDDETTDSFKGALKYIAELADEYAPDATLFVLTPLWTTEAPSTLKVPENTTDNNWMFVDAIYDGAEAYGWIPINMDLCGITPFTKSGLTLDNIHPNAAGTEKIVEYLSAELASYGENSKKETILFNKSDVSMKTGESTTLKAVQSPRSGTGTMTFTWSSSNLSVATVDANGKITAVAHGNAIITATTDNGVSATVRVTVDKDDHTYENGICTGCGENAPSESLSLRYDDRYDITGKTVEIVDAGTPTSFKVGYGVTEGTLDDAVITLNGSKLIATGIGTAIVRIDGILYHITVSPAPISLLLLIGQSNMQGSEGDENQSIVCPDGMVYTTYGDRYTMTTSNATNFVPSALTGAGSAVNVNGTTANLAEWPIYLLNEAGVGKKGPDSGFAYEWVQQTGEKVWIVNAAHGGSAISTWQDGGANYEECVLLFKACQQTLQKEIDAGHFTLSHMGYFWCQGCADASQTAEWYVNKYLTMHENLKRELTFDENTTFEFGGIVPILYGAGSYRAGVYADNNTKPYYESFELLTFNGPRVAQYWMTNNPELPDIWNVCNIGEDWVWMPDGTNGVTDYFQAHYPGGTVDYTTQVQQSASWYTPTTPKAVHDSIHYNQIGYNEVGREAARNALIILGEIPAPDVETTVELLSWDGYTPVEQVTASTAGNSGTLVVPKVYPVWKSKDVTYQLSDGLWYEYYDLLAESPLMDGTLSVVGTDVSVTVVGRELTSYAWELENGTLVSTGDTENTISKVSGSTENGVFIDTQYRFEKSITLLHDQNWVLEWKMTGPWYDAESTASKKLFCEDGASSTPNAMCLLIKGNENRITIGYYNGSTTHISYGLDLDDYGISMTDTHIYRLVNHINDDGTNTVYLFVDGKQIGPMTGYFTGTSGYMGETSDWLSGRDISFGYLGTPKYLLDNGVIEYISVVETGAAQDIHFHDWTEWETVTEPGPEGPGEDRRICSGCGETEVRVVSSIWQTTNILDHWSELPEELCSGVNLWEILEHDPKYYVNSKGDWGYHSSRDVPSVTISVNPGDRIYATSFGPANANGHGSSNGIRVTWFSVNGVLKTTDPVGTYAEFTANGGYLVAPEGAVAINIPMWGDKDSYEIYILNRIHAYKSTYTEPTCTDQGYVTHICTTCGDTYTDGHVDATGIHDYDDGVCIWCGISKLGSDWLVPDFAQGDYTMVVIPDPQNLVSDHSDTYLAMMQWIADNQETLNIQAVMNMGDMVNTNNAAEWTTSKAGCDLLNAAGIPWMPMRGNHDDSTWFNNTYGYETYGANQSWFGGSYEDGKLDHTYWFITVSDREYMILSLGWAPSWDVLAWAKDIVEAHADKNVIINCHAYMNSDGTFLSTGDAHCVSSYLSGYPNGDDVWAAFQNYENVVLAMGGHIHSANVVTWTGPNGAGEDVTSLLFDRQNDDSQKHYGMIALLTFHEGSDTVDINWYSTRYDALYKPQNQFAISVPHADDDTTFRQVDITNRFDSWTTGGPVLFSDGTAYGEPGYTSGSNPNLKHSGYISVEEFEMLQLTICARKGYSATGGFAFYSDAAPDAFISYASASRNGNGASSEGTQVRTIVVPEGAKYIRVTYWADSSSYASVPFSCIGYKTVPDCDHEFQETVTPPTCTEEGCTSLVCTLCGFTKLQETTVDITNQFVWTDGQMIQATSGKVLADTNWMASDYLNISGYTRLRIVTANTATKNSTIGLAFYDANKNYISGVRHTDNSGVYGILIHDLEVPENAVYIRSTWYSKKHASYDPAFGSFSCTAACKYSPALGHDFDTVVTPPTCTAPGYTTLVCGRCGHSEPDTVVTDISDLFTWTDGKMIIATTGEYTDFSVWQASDYVDISAYTVLEILTANTISNTTTTGLAFYDADKNYISGILHTDYPDEYGVLVHHIQIPENAVYIRTTWYSMSHPNYNSNWGDFYCKGIAPSITPATGHTPGEPVVENEGTHGSHDVVTYCTICGEELSREHDDGYLPGDINGDGAVNNKDVTRLFQYLSDYDVEVVEKALDVNGDGAVNNKDLTRLFQHLSDYEVELH